ncbi:hypothetical protein [Ferrovum myxofaciens]|uniref:hypothetical protein n=1 Tax=Ferrovum myxofaciens TaxID=416213 RepID=UPI0004E1532F|nr:hypothetical protein [Ferrovum myxofaciens]
MNWRKGFQNEFGNRVSWLVQNDRKTVVIGLIKLVNAIWFAGLWQAGFAINGSLFVWLVFFVVSIVIAARLDFYQGEKNG